MTLRRTSYHLECIACTKHEETPILKNKKEVGGRRAVLFFLMSQEMKAVGMF